MEVIIKIYTEEQAYKVEVNNEEDRKCLDKCIGSSLRLYNLLRTE